MHLQEAGSSAPGMVMHLDRLWRSRLFMTQPLVDAMCFVLFAEYLLQEIVAARQPFPQHKAMSGAQEISELKGMPCFSR